MSNLIQDYIKQIQSKFDTGGATEHTYRIVLETLLLGIANHITVTNEHERIVGVGMPDFTIKFKQDNTIPIGRIEAKDLHISLEESKNADQLKRYKDAFDNFVYTNYLTFIFYRNGKKIDVVHLGELGKNGIERKTDNLFDDNIKKLNNLLKEFLSFQGITITSPEKLAKAMAQKAQLIKYAIQSIFEQEENSNLELEYQAFKSLLVHDLTKSQFADMYAQTVAYGLFSARLYDPNLQTFSREEAEKLIPKSTPFIRWLFKQMSNDDEFDQRIAYIIDDLVNIFLHCNVAEILKNYGKKTKMEDPIIHFYETFLGEYDSNMRKKRGVYYTPEPIVKFIVKGVDYLLKTEFGLPEGLADTSKVEKEFKTIIKDHKGNESIKKEKKDIHRVQILDPATGTGTFLNEVVNYIYENYFKGQQGLWKSYVSKDLLSRIWGFEILMASYTMAHLKLGLTLTETGWHENERVNIYLTNSLEEPHDNLGTLFSQALAKESEEAGKVKREQPIMVVMGNPPYSISSSNKGEWIENLIKDYKKGLIEKSYNSLSDDYVKFIRFAEHFIEKNNEGILAFITNNSYLDGISFRVMREKLLKTFDSIHIVNLHGDVKKKEISPDGGKDENVFDIQQGTAIIFGVKSKNKKDCKVSYLDIYGTRNHKYSFLNNNTLEGIKWENLKSIGPDFFFIQKNYSNIKSFQKGVKINELFIDYGPGVESGKDEMFIGNNKHIVSKIVSEKFNVIRLGGSFTVSKSYDWVKKMGQSRYDEDKITKYQYKPYDIRSIYYDPLILRRGNQSIFQNVYKRDNIGICIMRSQVNAKELNTVFCSQSIIDKNFYGFQTYFLPLYIYNDNGTERKPNLNQVIIDEIAKKIGAIWVSDGQGDKKTTIGPEDIFDYIYAVLHSPTYRKFFKDFLKTDFPRVPFTDNIKIFWQCVLLGNQLRKLHLMDGIERKDITATYPIEGNNIVEKIGKDSFRGNKVYINDTQYFEGISGIARNFQIGGYQPAQKRLKDRQGETLNYEDIIHYQKIAYILEKTNEIMQNIDKVAIL